MTQLNKNDIDSAVGGAEQALFSRLQKLVEEKTRFDGSAVSLKQASVSNYRYLLRGHHRLLARVVSTEIYGGFRPAEGDVRVNDPSAGAEQQLTERANLAVRQLEDVIAGAPTTYRPVTDGLFLKASNRYWRLSGCRSCDERGHRTCGDCGGAKKINCRGCGGQGWTDCTVMMCNNGYISCTWCHERGQRQESYQDYVNGQYVTRNHWVTCGHCTAGWNPCRNCINGRKQCSRCDADNKEDCPGCDAKGQISCHWCSATGAVGTEAHVDVALASTYSHEALSEPHPAISAFLENAGFTELPAISAELHLSGCTIDCNESKGSGDAVYEGSVSILTMEVACANKGFEVVAFGTQQQWYSFDGIFEHLLANDLDELKQILPKSVAGNLFGPAIAPILDRLRSVVESEANTDLILKSDGPLANTAGKDDSVSDYGQDLARTVNRAIGACYAWAGRRIVPLALLLTSAFYLALWAGIGKFVALIALPLTFPAYHFLGKWLVRSRIRKAVAAPNIAVRVITAADRTWHSNTHDVIVAVTLAAVMAFIFQVVPVHGPYEAQLEVAYLKFRLRMSMAEPMQLEEIEQVLAGGRYPDYTHARKSLEIHVKEGKAEAYGMYGYMVMYRHGELRLPDAESAAKGMPWVEAGLQRSDPWAVMARALQQIRGLGLKSDHQQGLATLSGLAQSGNSTAALLLARHYQYSSKPNGETALYWYQKLAKESNSTAMVEIGSMYWRGQGVPKNRKVAQQWWKKAAALGNRDAQYRLENPPIY